ncbi:MAG: tyrosine-type recombinase/integrase [Dehalococcoidales bacterium]|nr:tyrosine-type recombinase/integrase [Dehalococcoidales bacterium]
MNGASDRNRTYDPRFTKASPDELIIAFIASRREGLSTQTIERRYKGYLRRSKEVIGLHIDGQDIQNFLKTRQCNAAKFDYYSVLRIFYNWLYSRNSGYGLNVQDNPILNVEAPRVEKKILVSLTSEEVERVINRANSIRDKAIISLFADSGLRLDELANISPKNIDWQNRLIKVKCKGNKEGYAPFGQRTESLLREWLSEYKANGRLWDLNHYGVSIMLRRLSASTGIKFSAHTFRRTFASILAKRNVDSLHIMRLGRWSSVAMVERYTRSVKFEDSLKLYNAIVN